MTSGSPGAIAIEHPMRETSTSNTNNDEIFSQSGEPGFERPKEFVTPVQCRRKLGLRGGRRPTDTSIAAKAAVFQKQSSIPSTMADFLALHDTPDDSSVRSAPVIRSGSLRRILRSNFDDSPSGRTADSTLTEAEDDSKIVISPAASTGGGSVLSRYGKPEDFTPGSRRRSWMPKTSPNEIPNSAPAGRKTKVGGSLRNIKLPLMDNSGHRAMDTSTHSVPSGYRKGPPLTSSAGAAAGFAGYGKPDAFLSTPVSKQKKSWRPKKISAVGGTVAADLPPAFRASLESPKRKSAPAISPLSHAKLLDLSKIERVPKREKSNLKPMKLKRRWPPTTSTVDTNKISTGRIEGVVPNQAVRTRRTNFEKVYKEGEKITEDPLAMKHAGSNHSAKSVGTSDFGGPQGPTGSLDGSGQDLDLANARWAKGVADASPTLVSPHREISMRIRWGGNTFHTAEGRPCYFEDRHPNPQGLGGLLEDRFAAMKADGMPVRPRRRPSLEHEWSDDEDDSVDGGDMLAELCPDVWITPMDGDVDAATDLWRVRRVWNVDDLDDHEVEHAVEEGELLNVVKVLTGVTDEPATNADGDQLTYDPDSTLWKAKTVYDVMGEIDESSPTLDMSERDIRQVIGNISVERAAGRDAINAKFSYQEGIDEGDDDEEWGGQPMTKSASARFTHGSGAPLHDDDDEWQGRDMPKSASARFTHGSGAPLHDDDDEWNGKRVENRDDKAPTGKSVHGLGDSEDDDDDEWGGKAVEKKEKNASVNGKFSYGDGDDDDEDEGDWNGTRVAKKTDAGTSDADPSTNDAKCSYGAGEDDGDEDGDWNGRKVEKSEVKLKKADGKCVYEAGEDHSDDEGEWNGKRREKVNSKMTYGSGENDDDEDDEWNGKLPQREAQKSGEESGPAAGEHPDAPKDKQAPKMKMAKMSKWKTLEDEPDELVSPTKKKKKKKGRSLEDGSEGLVSPTQSEKKEKKKKKKKDKTLEDDSDELASPRRKSKKGEEEESEEFASGELTTEKKEKKKGKKKKKKKEKDYEHGMTLSDLLAPPPTKIFHSEFY